MSEKYEVRIEGIRPLLMHSCNSMLEESNNKATRAKEHNPKTDAEAALYKDKEGNIVVPSFCVLSCLRGSAVNFQVPGKGKKTYKNFIYAGVRMETENIPLITENGWQIDAKTVVVQRSRIVRARPRFDNWALEFTMEIVDPIITPAVLKQIIEDAGRYSGLLDFRPLYGLFSLVRFERVVNEGEEV